MKNINTLSRKQNWLLYSIFTTSGILMLIIAQDISWGGIALALAIIFHPSSHKHWKDLSLIQRIAIPAQMVLALLLMAISFFQVITG